MDAPEDGRAVSGTHIALLTESRFAAPAAAPGDWYLSNILRDDHLLQSALERRGFTSERVDWARSDVDWSRFGCAVFRTTWDYVERHAQFTAWIEHNRVRTRLCNDAETLLWNMDKHYLADLETKGIAIVPSRFIERGTPTSLRALLDESGWVEAVIKPCISGGARHTYRVRADNADELEPVVRSLLASEALILQPFLNRVTETGEDTLMVFNGRYSHAVRKLPKAGDFRVQDDHGGTVHDRKPSEEQIDLAERAVAAAPQVPAYGRVDLVRDDRDNWVVMELELIEPELWLRNHPPSADTFAGAIAEWPA